MLGASGTAEAATSYVSGSGSDSNPCTQADPCRTIPEGADAAGSGGELVVQAGTYDAGSSESISTAGLHVRAATGETPVLTGSWRATGDDQEWGPGLTFEGVEGSMWRNFDIRADRTEFHHNEASGGEDGACVLVGNVDSVGSSVHDNYIHDCGSTDESRANLDHCIYAGDPIDFEVYNNVIDTCISRGVQLYPAGSGAHIHHNTIIDAGRNGLLSNGNDNPVFENNIVVGSGSLAEASDHEYAVRISSATSGAVVRNNVFWQNVEDAVTGSHSGSDNLVADPLFVDQFHIDGDSPAVGWAFPGSSPLTDYDGGARDSAPDAGADEFVGTEPTPEPTPDPTPEPTPDPCG